MHQHLGNFPRKLSQHAHAVYEYVACPPVGYPELKEEMWCHRYYLRNLCDDRFSDWPIVDHIPLLQVGATPLKLPRKLWNTLAMQCMYYSARCLDPCSICESKPMCRNSTSLYCKMGTSERHA